MKLWFWHSQEISQGRVIGYKYKMKLPALTRYVYKMKWTLLFFSHSRHFSFHFTHLLCRSSSSSFCCRFLSASFRSLSRFMVSSSNRSIFLPRSILSSLSGGWYITRVTDTKPPAVRSYGNRDTLHQSKRTWIWALTNPNTEQWVGGISLHSGYACFCSCL